MFTNPILFKDDYDDYYDDDYFEEDDEEFEGNLKKEQKKFWDDSLKKYHLKFTEVPAFYDRYKKRMTEYMKRIGCSCLHRVTVSNALCDYLENHEPDREDYFFWRVCLYDDNYVFFGADEDKDFDKQDILMWFFKLLNEIECSEKIYANQKKAREEYTLLMSEIVFSEEPVGEIDLQKVKSAVLPYEISGECFEDNLENLTDRICHSPNLFKIAPLVFYVALMRYTKKMTDSQDYKMNFSKALRRFEYGIDKDNGKNIDNFYLHISLFLDLCDTLCPDEENRYLCYSGFNAITNICECPLIYWDDFGPLTPQEYRLRDMYFSGFAGGDSENPCNVESTVAYIDLMRYEEYDDRLPKKKKFLGKIRDYINGNPHLCRDYIRLIDEKRTEECIPIVNEVINESGIDLEGCGVRMQALLQAIIIKELMECICVRVRDRLVGLMGRFDKIIFS